MGEKVITSDFVSCIVHFGRAMQSAVRVSADASLTEYRVLSYLDQHGEGVTPGKIAEALGLTGGSVSPAMGRLLEKVLVDARISSENSSSYTAVITERGRRKLEQCDKALLLAYDDFFEPLSEDLLASLLSGSVVTSSFLGVTRMNGSSYFAENSVLTGFLRNEQYFTNTTRNHGLSLGEFRVLQLLSEHPSMGCQKSLQEYLIAHKSELSGWCKSLETKGLVSRRRDLRDGRRSLLALTAQGFQKLEETRRDIDISLVRPAQPAEIVLFNDMFHIIMEQKRESGRAAGHQP